MNASATNVTPITRDVSGFHTRLNVFNADRFKPGRVTDHWECDTRDAHSLSLEEGRFLENERAAVAAIAATAPSDADGFMHWFTDLQDHGPGQNDPLFPWLAERAEYEEMRWFLKQEVAGEAGFEDLVALTQVRFPTGPKLEMARNYWDEMGRGHERGMHAGMLEDSASEFNLSALATEDLWEALALGNLMAGLACNRRYAYQSVGALGVIEMTAPSRVSLVNQGLIRLGVSAKGRQYFQLHAGLDIRHSEAWNREVIRPLVAADGSLARSIAEGALMRLRAGERCFSRYRAELGLN